MTCFIIYHIYINLLTVTRVSCTRAAKNTKDYVRYKETKFVQYWSLHLSLMQAWSWFLLFNTSNTQFSCKSLLSPLFSCWNATEAEVLISVHTEEGSCVHCATMGEDLSFPIAIFQVYLWRSTSSYAHIYHVISCVFNNWCHVSVICCETLLLGDI